MKEHNMILWVLAVWFWHVWTEAGWQRHSAAICECWLRNGKMFACFCCSLVLLMFPLISIIEIVIIYYYYLFLPVWAAPCRWPSTPAWPSGRSGCNHLSQWTPLLLTPRRPLEAQRNDQSELLDVAPHTHHSPSVTPVHLSATYRHVWVRATHTGGCKKPPTAGNWRGSCPPPRAGSACWPFGSAVGWTAPPWSLMRCTLWARTDRLA